MPINAVEKLHYQAMVLDIANKILITSKNGILWAVEALEYIVIRNKKVPKGDHIPTAIYQRAKELRDLIKEKDMYARPEDFPEYVSIIKETVGSKIKSLLWLSQSEVQKLIQSDRQRMAAAKKRKPPILPRQNPHVSVASEEEVAIYDQWRLNLMYPLGDQPGLNQDEMANLANLIHNEKYPWACAMLLTANIPLAHWIASPDINSLIYNGILNSQSEEHLAILMEPTPEEMLYLSLLSPLLNHSLITVDQVLDLELTPDEQQTLSDPALRERFQSLPLQKADYDLLTEMGVLGQDNDEEEEEDNDQEYEEEDAEENDDVVFTWTRSSRPK